MGRKGRPKKKRILPKIKYKVGDRSKMEIKERYAIGKMARSMAPVRHGSRMDERDTRDIISTISQVNRSLYGMKMVINGMRLA